MIKLDTLFQCIKKPKGLWNFSLKQKNRVEEDIKITSKYIFLKRLNKSLLFLNGKEKFEFWGKLLLAV